jgi:hypothetical protein
MMSVRTVRAGLLALLWSFVAAAGSAQEDPSPDSLVTVEGEVLDGMTGLPLSGVMVALHDIWRLTWTDELGYFSLDNVPRGAHELGVYGLGYMSVEEYIPFDGTEIFGINLSPAPVELEGLTVEVLSAQQFQYRSFGQRYDFIGPELMNEMRVKYNHITDMLRSQFPGINIYDPGGPNSGICIMNARGTTSIYGGETNAGCALMFIDGLEADPTEVSALHPEAIGAIQYIARIEARLAWGERGRYGVLLIETRRGGREELPE